MWQTASQLSVSEAATDDKSSVRRIWGNIIDDKSTHLKPFGISDKRLVKCYTHFGKYCWRQVEGSKRFGNSSFRQVECYTHFYGFRENAIDWKSSVTHIPEPFTDDKSNVTRISGYMTDDKSNNLSVSEMVNYWPQVKRYTYFGECDWRHLKCYERFGKCDGRQVSRFKRFWNCDGRYFFGKCAWRQVPPENKKQTNDPPTHAPILHTYTYIDTYTRLHTPPADPSQ